jgi:molecular chaperone DnaJ
MDAIKSLIKETMPGNSVPGDLIVAIEELEHEFLKREGENLHYDLYISFSEAVLGVSKDIEAINGVRIKLKKVFNQENLEIKR